MIARRIGCSAWIKWVLLSLVGIAFGVQTGRGQTQPMGCENAPIEFLGGPTEAPEIVCAAARQAVQILGQCGIEAVGRIRVEIVDTLDSQCGAPAYGIYDASTSVIKLTSLSACIAHMPPGSSYSKLVPRAAYQSIVVHEVTHGLVSNLTRGRPLSRVAQEYVAYVVQIQSMGADDRSKFLGTSSEEPAGEIWHLNELVYYLNPEKFAALVYGHFKHPLNGCGFLQRIIRREVSFPEIGFAP